MLYCFRGISTNGAKVVNNNPYLKEFVLGLKFVLYGKPKNKARFRYRSLVPDKGAPRNSRNQIKILFVDLFQAIVAALYPLNQFVSSTTDLS